MKMCILSGINALTKIVEMRAVELKHFSAKFDLMHFPQLLEDLHDYYEP